MIKKNGNNEIKTLSHSTYRCQYHIVFAPKYRRKEIYGKLRKDIGEIIRKLCEQKGVEIIEAEACKDHIHLLVSIPPYISVAQFMGYIRLTHLLPELLKLVDEERIAFTPAVELSYLSENEQKILFEEIEYADATPSLSQAQRLRKFSEQGRLSIDTIFAVLSEEKPNQKEQVKFKTEDIRKYFPKSYTSLDMQKTIITLLEKWQRQRERNRGEAR